MDKFLLFLLFFLSLNAAFFVLQMVGVVIREEEEEKVKKKLFLDFPKLANQGKMVCWCWLLWDRVELLLEFEMETLV